MKNNNTNEHVRRLHHHKPELRGPTKTNSLSMIENRDAQKSLSERGTTEDLWQKMLNKYVLSVIACVLCVRACMHACVRVCVCVLLHVCCVLYPCFWLCRFGPKIASCFTKLLFLLYFPLSLMHLCLR